MRNIWTIARREYSRFFTSPVAYVVAFLILLTIGIMFALTILVYTQDAYSGQSGGSAPDFTGLSSTFTFLLVLAVPALTMRLVADESRMGTMELLLTAPVRDWELIIGKWLGGFLYILTLIAVTLIYPLILNFYVSPGIDQRLMMSSYLGLILISAALLALGVGMSALFTNQIAAFFATLAVFMVIWWLIGFPAQYVTAGSQIFSYLDLRQHFDSLNGGTINLSDVIYPLSLTALGLFIGSTAVEVRRWS